MAEYINTIEIDTADVSNAADLCEAYAAALAKALNWEQDGAMVLQPNTNLCFKFQTMIYGSIYYAVAFAVAKTTPLFPTSAYSSFKTATYNASNRYMLDWIQTTGTIAIGIRTSTSEINLTALIAQNTLGDFVAFTLGLDTTYPIVMGNKNTVSYTKIPYLLSNTASTVSTTITKYTDMYGGATFKDLYLMVSSPFTTLDRVYYIEDKYFRYVGHSTYGFAIPVG